MGWLLFGAFFLFMLIGIPIGVSIGLSSVFILLISHIPLDLVPQTMFEGNNSFALVAVPFFVLAGDLLAKGGISKKIVSFAESFLARIKGGLSLVAILSSMFIAAISGSGAATTAAVGAALLPELKEKKYDLDFSASLIASSGTIGVVIPPSVPMVLYAVIAGESVSRLFMGGFIPGLLMGAVLIFIAIKVAYRRNYPLGDKTTFVEKIRKFFDAFWGLLTPIIILGGIFSGVFTPSEAAAIAVVYTVIVAWIVYRELNFKKLFNIVIGSAITSSLVMFIIATAKIFSWDLAFYNIPSAIAEGLMKLSFGNKFLVLLIINIIILIAGVFMETASALIILTPIFLPTVIGLGVNLIHFGLIIVIGLAIGMITPPVAINIYVASAVSGLTLEEISKAILPMLLSLIAVLLLITYFPAIVMFLPNLFMGG